MAQEDLIPFNQLTEEEQKKIASKGGRASVRARRERKLIKEQLELLLSLPVKDLEFKEKINKLGVNKKEIDNQMALLVSIYKKALHGDVQAATFIRDSVGDKPDNNINFNGPLPVVITGEDELEE